MLQAGFLADLAASRQLFAFHLPDMCEEGSASAALFDAMSEGARAGGKLLSVMGYFPKQEVRNMRRCSRCSQQFLVFGSVPLGASASTRPLHAPLTR